MADFVNRAFEETFAQNMRGVFVDCEIASNSHAIADFGAVDTQGDSIHTSDPRKIRAFCANADFLCGHNIVAFDIKFLGPLLAENPEDLPDIIDTLPLSALLFPQQRFHALLKNEKLVSTEVNNPLSDAIKARDLLHRELVAFAELSPEVRSILARLLYTHPLYKGFFSFFKRSSQNAQSFFKSLFSAFVPTHNDSSALRRDIRKVFGNDICAHADIESMIKNHPTELGLVLAYVTSKDHADILPAWEIKNFPRTQDLLEELRNTPCQEGCVWCNKAFDANAGLKRFFGFDAFRTFEGKPLQHDAAQAALDGKSLLAVFPTGGGKSITFQVPALMQAKTTGGLTVVISPLQSLMKDQVDHLLKAGIEGAGTINGSLSPIERAQAIEDVATGKTSILYIAPESLRSKSIETLLSERRISRFVIDEAHCFSAWGHDFRVDYLYIAEFIAQLQQKQDLKRKIPVSCFTATAKQKVISDIQDYFNKRLGLDLDLFATDAARRNLHYKVLHVDNDDDKYRLIRELLTKFTCPSIIYVSRTRTAEDIAQRLTADGIAALPYHGQMEVNEKAANQDEFLSGNARIIVATNAFGMGVDKKDVGLVIHHDISSSLENYVQEAGRAGRDPSLDAVCYVLFNENDLNAHFSMLSQTKVSQADIQNIWRAIKSMTKTSEVIEASTLQIARAAGLDPELLDVDTRVKTALAALEMAGYLVRGRNSVHVFASGMAVDSFDQANSVIENNPLFPDDKTKTTARRIIRALISERRTHGMTKRDGESRVDHMADNLGLEMPQVLDMIDRLRLANLLNKNSDMTAIFEPKATFERAKRVLKNQVDLENFVLKKLCAEDSVCDINLKELNGSAQKNGLTISETGRLRQFFRTLKRIKLIERLQSCPHSDFVQITKSKLFDLKSKTYSNRNLLLATFILKKLFDAADRQSESAMAEREKFSLSNASTAVAAVNPKQPVTAAFCVADIYDALKKEKFFSSLSDIEALNEIKSTLLWFVETNQFKILGGFMVLYQGLRIQRKVTDNKRRYRLDDYRILDEYYRQKIQQIHIVGEYANLMLRDYAAALDYVHDYFVMDYEEFLKKYFAGDRNQEIKLNMTAKLYQKLFGSLSPKQSEIIESKARNAVVAAGPGSGKTRVLVHKLAALLCTQDVRPEQLLMLTFSRAAATEFKRRLIDLIGRKAYYVDIKTFHSYAFDVVGRLGSLEDSENILSLATKAIVEGTAVEGKIAKTTLVIDEAQDTGKEERALLRALMRHNEDMRIVAVGDDDQNIYAFRGSDSRLLTKLASSNLAVMFEMRQNWRSTAEIVALSNAWAETISQRIKRFPGQAVRSEQGRVTIVEHRFPELVAGAVHRLAQALRDEHLTGSTALLTQTNEEAYLAACLLQSIGIRARIVEGQNEVMPANMVEVRALIRYLQTRCPNTPLVPNSLWQEALENLCRNFSSSIWLKSVVDYVKSFIALYPKDATYLSDFVDFIEDSRIEDLQAVDAKGFVTISTVHKAKGREFDNVWMLINRSKAMNDEIRRVIFVGLTRAKTRLEIHTDEPCFSAAVRGLDGKCVSFLADESQSPQPDEILLSLTMRDVYLDFYIGRKSTIFKTQCGQKLVPEDHGAVADIDGRPVKVAAYSQAFEKKLSEWKNIGYEPQEAHVHYIVAWHKPEDETEHAVLLPTLKLKKVPNSGTSVSM